MPTDMQQMVMNVMSISLLVGIGGAVLGLILFFILVLPKNKFKKALLNDVNVPLTFSGVESNYLLNAKYNRSNNTLIIQKQAGTDKAHIYLKTLVDGKVRVEFLLLDFVDADYVEIELKEGTTDYAIIIDRVNGKRVKTEHNTNKEVGGMIVITAIVAVLTAVGNVLYAYACNYYIADYAPEYMVVYIVSVVAPLLIIGVIGVGLTLVMNVIIHKGGK